ncbi:hypothetical protein B0H10DRAFT_1940850 [Mycena sp. CBHHK59/15]|nr:hypothetical protein B0H10DRAFT_1940850 [Mycena sp. CBHHK59/15]
MSVSVGKLDSKRIQFHIDAATSLPLPKRSRKAPMAYVSVKITDLKDRLKTSVVKGQINPTWQQNLTSARLRESSEVTFEVKHRSVWPRPGTSRLATTDPYPLSTLLKMQGGNTFGTSEFIQLDNDLVVAILAYEHRVQDIELPLHAAIDTASGKSAMGSLTVNIRELTSLETAQLLCETADRMSGELQEIQLEGQNLAGDSGASSSS